MTDPIADMLTRIRNAVAVKKKEIILPMSKVKFAVAKILERENLVGKTDIIKKDLNISKDNKNYNFDQLRIVLKYKENNSSVINNLKKISKPGLKIYVGSDKLPRVLNNLGMAIISTSQGLMTNREARKRKIGGEVICEIY